MAEFKDKLFKAKKQKLDPINVIKVSRNEYNFIDWLSDNCYLFTDKRIFSLKRLARMFLSEHPNVYTEYDMAIAFDEETIRIAQDKSFWEED